MTDKNNPVYKTIKAPIGSGYRAGRGYGWIQVDKLIGADNHYGIVKNGIYKVVSYDQAEVGILTPQQPFGNETREMIPEQYHWVSTEKVLKLTQADEELKVGDRVVLKEHYMRYKCGKVLKVEQIKFDSDGMLVNVGCPQDNFWVYSHRLQKF